MVDSAKGRTGVEGISTKDNITFEWDVGQKTTEELRQEVADALNVSLDSAMAIIEAAMDHMPDLKAELDTNDYQAALSSMVSKSGDTVTVTEAELDALKAKYGDLAKSVEQDLATISE
jgi:O-phosphoseryl-tRNA(Cys) synthetase